MKSPKLPQTDSIQELAEFWDTHDLADFEPELEEVGEPVFVRDTTLTLRGLADAELTERVEHLIGRHGEPLLASRR